MTNAKPAITPVDYSLPQAKVFLNCAKCIQHGIGWLESQTILPSIAGTPVYNNAENMLNDLKSISMEWVNKIYPEYLEMPHLIQAKGQSINNNVELLIQMAHQLKSDPGNAAIKKMIVTYTDNLKTVVSKLYKMISSLGQELHKFEVALETGEYKISPVHNQCYLQIRDYNKKLIFVTAQYHHMQSDHCPSSSALEALQKEGHRLEKWISASKQFLGQLSDIGSNVQEVVSSLTYFANYWDTVATEASRTVLIMNKVKADVPSILELDLQEMFKNWKALLQFYTQLSAEIAKEKLIS